MWVVWFGRPLKGERATALQRIKQRHGKYLDVVTVTVENVRLYEVAEEPFHPGFEHLSAVHKSDYLFSYLAHHYGGGFHDMKNPSSVSWLPFFKTMDSSPFMWFAGNTEHSPHSVACNEDAATDDPACLALRATRGETRTQFSLVHHEPRTSCINGTLDLFDATRGACCMRVRRYYQRLVNVQSFIARPRTPITADWLAINHRHMDYKLERLRAHPAPTAYPRCCFHHEFGYPINWSELKGDALHPMMLKHASHILHKLPPNKGLVHREDVDALASGKLGWIDLSQPMS